MCWVMPPASFEATFAERIAAATPAERQAACRKARQELDGLIDIPDVAAAQIEQRIAGELER